MARDILIEFKGKKTWRKAFQDRGKQLPIELNGRELYIIAGSLIRQKIWLEKEKRFEDAKEVEKLQKQFDSFWEIAVDKG